MTEAHWKAEEITGGWGIRYNPTPGGVQTANGTRSFSLSFIALHLTDMVSEPEAAARAITHELNSHSDLLDALARAASWFNGYAESHTAKGDTDKAKRNQDRADACLAAITKAKAIA